MTQKFKVWSTRGGKDAVLAYFKATSGKGKDVPCLQASPYTSDEKATLADLRDLLGAVKAAADWVDIETVSLSDHYKAHHGYLQPLHKTLDDGSIAVPITKEVSTNVIIISKDKKRVVTPFVWFTLETLTVNWGWFEAAIETAIKLMEDK